MMYLQKRSPEFSEVICVDGHFLCQVTAVIGQFREITVAGSQFGEAADQRMRKMLFLVNCPGIMMLLGDPPPAPEEYFEVIHVCVQKLELIVLVQKEWGSAQMLPAALIAVESFVLGEEGKGDLRQEK